MYDLSVVALSSIGQALQIQYLFVFLVIVASFIFIGWSFSTSKSKQYRELMTDMYVVGMIKKYAAEDNIDLLAELKEYVRIQKKAKLRMKGLDSAIEDELKEKIAKVSEEHTNKK